MSLLLKLSPLVDELSLYDVVNTPGVAADLSHISSNAVSAVLPWKLFSLADNPPPKKTTGYLPANEGAKAAFKDADIIVIPAGIPRTSSTLRPLRN